MYVIFNVLFILLFVYSDMAGLIFNGLPSFSVIMFAFIVLCSVVLSVNVTVIVPSVAIASPCSYFVLLGAVMSIFFTSLLNVTFKFVVKSCPFV